MPLEWLIDIIKEWVLSLTYATEAWVEAAFLKLTDVPKWTNPLSVAGELSPDATCTYLKAGTYNDKPYYRRLDGTWHIWFLPVVPRWYISIELGDVGLAFWYRDSSEVEGVYQPEEDAEGTATVVTGHKYLKTGFVDRGDPAAPDWPTGAFTRDGAWHDLDLSGIVPANAKGVLFAVEMVNVGLGKSFYLRSKGNVNSVNVSRRTIAVAGVTAHYNLTCPCDENRLVQYKATAVGWVGLNLSVNAWWF